MPSLKENAIGTYAKTLRTLLKQLELKRFLTVKAGTPVPLLALYTIPSITPSSSMSPAIPCNLGQSTSKPLGSVQYSESCARAYP